MASCARAYGTEAQAEAYATGAHFAPKLPIVPIVLVVLPSTVLLPLDSTIAFEPMTWSPIPLFVTVEFEIFIVAVPVEEAVTRTPSLLLPDATQFSM